MTQQGRSCTLCGEFKDADQFCVDQKSRRLKSWCRPCTREKNTSFYRRLRKENPARMSLKRRVSHLKLTFGLTIAEYEALVQRQDRRCAICRQVPGGRGRFHIDHDHHTGVIRGLLCCHCNAGLGQFRDSAALLRMALVYLDTARLGATERAA